MDPEDRRTLVEAAMSFGQVTALLSQALSAEHPGAYAYVREVWDDRVVYAVEAKGGGSVTETWRRAYALADDGKATLGEPEKVREVTAYVRIAESTVGTPSLLEAIGTDNGTFDVLLIEAGLGKNRRRYRPEVLKESVPLFDGARSFAPEGGDHGLGRRGPRELVGWFDNPRWYEGEHPVTGKVVVGVAANYHVLESAGWLRSNLAEAIAARKPDLIGFSIVGDGEKRVMREASGPVIDVGRITGIESVDPVVNPAQGGVALRLVASTETPLMDWEKLTLAEAVKALATGSILPDELKAKRPDLLESIQSGRLTEAAPAPDDRLIETRIASAMTPVFVESALAARPGLHDAVKGRVRDMAKGRTLSEAEVGRLIETEVEFLASISPALVKDPAPTITDVKDERDRFVESIDDMLSGRSSDSMRELYVSLTGDSGMTGRLQPGGRLTESVVTGTFTEIFSDGINRAMLREYAQLGLDTWRRFVDIVPVRDFKTQERLQWGGYGNLPAVSQGAPYTALSTPSETKATYAATKRGGTEDLTLEAVANDDLGQMRRIPRKLARAAAQTLHEFVYDFIKSNATLTTDSVALFNSAHGSNLGSTALAASTLSAARLVMKKQTDPGSSKKLGITPRFLLVPQDLEQTAYELTATDREVASANNTLNFIKTFGLTPIVVDYWTDVNNWYLVADPSQVATIEVGFFQGREEPELFIQDQPTVGMVFSNDRLTWKIRHIYGGGLMDFRGFFGAVVA